MLGRGCTAFRGGRRPAPIHKLESRSAGLLTHARVVLRNWVILTARVFVGTHVPAEVPAEDFTGAFVYAVRASLLATPEMDVLTLIDEVWYTEYKTKMRKIVAKMSNVHGCCTELCPILISIVTSVGDPSQY